MLVIRYLIYICSEKCMTHAIHWYADVRSVIMLDASVPLMGEEIKAIRSGYSESVCLCDLKKRNRGEHK